MRHIFAIAGALALSAGLMFASGELSGRRAPGFALPDSNLKVYDLQDFRGKVVLLDIMQTGCAHCQAFSRVLDRVKSRYGGKVAILMIVNPPDNQTTVQNYIREFGVTDPVLFDCGQAASSYVKATPQHPQINIPHVFLIDAQGIIRNDFEYSLLTHAIFEGDGIFAELDKLLAPAKKP